jgi:hypothetical protein
VTGGERLAFLSIVLSVLFSWKKGRVARSGTVLMSCATWLASAQTPAPTPKFEAADVHVSAKTNSPYLQTVPVIVIDHMEQKPTEN